MTRYLRAPRLHRPQMGTVIAIALFVFMTVGIIAAFWLGSSGGAADCFREAVTTSWC